MQYVFCQIKAELCISKKITYRMGMFAKLWYNKLYCNFEIGEGVLNGFYIKSYFGGMCSILFICVYSLDDRYYKWICGNKKG